MNGRDATAKIVLSLLLLSVLVSLSEVYGQIYMPKSISNVTRILEGENLVHDGLPVMILYESPNLIVVKEKAIITEDYFWKSIGVMIRNDYDIASVMSVPTKLDLKNGLIDTDNIALLTH
jgi:hypothetical protein